MWLQVLIDFIDALKIILSILGLYSDPTTKQEDEE